MRSSFLTGLVFASATLLGAGAAYAGPLPAGGGPLETTESSFESLVQTPGDVLNGITRVTSIDGTLGNSFTPGPGLFISSIFSGFTLASVDTTNPANTVLSFTGGSLKYYTSATDPFAGGALTNCPACATPADFTAFQATAMTNLAAGANLWLNLQPEVIGPGGITLIIDLNASSVTNFANAATRQVYLDIIGGSAQNAFVKDTIVNSFIIANGPSDTSYQGSANSHCFTASGWNVCGTNHLDATAIPEPVTLSLFGAGLAGAAAIRRRKAKKA